VSAGATVKQESIPWQSFVSDAVSVIHDSKHLARSPGSAGDWAMAILQIVSRLAMP
jgi:hypothetical protein